MYSHLNNSIYVQLIDSVVNTYLIQRCNFSPSSSPQIGVVASSKCEYFSFTSFPAELELCLRVNKLGQSSVEYEVGIFERGREDVCAVGGFVHVFVDRASMKTSARGMNWDLRTGLDDIYVKSRESVL